jgi:hypothetical protein
VWRAFFFIFFIQTYKMSHHSGTTICHKANIWYISIICTWYIESTSMQRKTYKHNLNSGKHIYKHQLLITQKSHYKVYLFKAFKHNINYIKKRMAPQIHISHATRAMYKRLKRWTTHVPTIMTVTMSFIRPVQCYRVIMYICGTYSQSINVYTVLVIVMSV